LVPQSRYPPYHHPVTQELPPLERESRSASHRSRRILVRRAVYRSQRILVRRAARYADSPEILSPATFRMKNPRVQAFTTRSIN
jgi:hypothetical protein